MKNFTDESLVVTLYKYDPRLADVSAKTVQTVNKKMAKLNKTDPFLYVAHLGVNIEKDEGAKYYVTAKVVDGKGKRIYYGYKNGKKGMGKVLENSNHSDILMILKPM